jgi:alkanesulfonate monooxygenase SsuD/methylene tetrahydromethanopterin reductase-like flavin-dependent oxidoreductase (luciferase family)
VTTYGLDVPAFTSSDPADYYSRFVSLAESAGFSNLWIGDHLLWHRPRFESFALLGMLAGLTRLTLGTAVALAPLRPPWWLAKTAATLHELAPGGLVLGLGTGGEYTREFDVAGADPSKRGAALDQAIEYCRNAWSGTLGDDYSPRPDSPIPIWLGGRKKVAMRRVARTADGWLALFLTPDRFAEGLAYLQAECRANARPMTTAAIALWTCIDTDSRVARQLALETISREYGTPGSAFERYLITGTPHEVSAVLGEYIAAGADHIEIHIAHPDPLSQAALWTRDLMPGWSQTVPG